MSLWHHLITETECFTFRQDLHCQQCERATSLILAVQRDRVLGVNSHSLF